MVKIIQAKQKQAYDTEENWFNNNPILLAGQLAYSKDKYGKYKIGNGISQWRDLEYTDNTFTGTREEYEIKNSNGEIKPGTIVNITDDNDYSNITIDTELSETSHNLIENQAITLGLNNKVDKISGKALSTNDYTDEEKNKLLNIENGAKNNVQSDWNDEDINSDAYIKNKPVIPKKAEDIGAYSKEETDTYIETINNTNQNLQNLVDQLTERINILEDIISSNEIKAMTSITDSNGDTIVTNNNETLIITDEI